MHFVFLPAGAFGWPSSTTLPRVRHGAALPGYCLQGGHSDRMHALITSTLSPASGIVGDITPVCGVSDEEKFRLEEAALLRLKETLGPVASAEEMESLWREYEAGSTPEAAIVKDFDKVCFAS